MKKLFVALFVASCLLAASMPVYAGTAKNWELVYENNADGTVKTGALADLVSAIRSGADVQVVAYGPDSDVLVKSRSIYLITNVMLLPCGVVKAIKQVRRHTGTSLVSFGGTI